MHFKTSHVIVYHSVCGIVYSGKENFKTSHVIVYLEFRDRFLCKIHYFKTSHVIVYRSICRFLRIRLCNFKTSHVIVYRSICRFLRIRLCNFKTSHVIVYQQQIYDYIAVEANFKTSHVIVYLCFLVLQFLLSSTFQNISCYCLSIPDTDEAFEMVEFQNISCYCLSGYQAVCNCKSDISKHLMLLFIAFYSCVRKYNIHFKTSHVIVYLVFELISYYPKLFQNISCYCLSAIASQQICHL